MLHACTCHMLHACTCAAYQGVHAGVEEGSGLAGGRGQERVEQPALLIQGHNGRYVQGRGTGRGDRNILKPSPSPKLKLK